MLKEYRERFVSDFNLPISSFEDAHFDYLLELYDSTYNTRQLYNFYQDTIKKYGSEERFFKQYNILISKIRQDLKFFYAFNNFNELKIEQEKILVKTTTLYKKTNDKKLYYSIDLKQANFHALKYVNPNLVLNCNTYEDFLKYYTNDEYVIKSKNFRMMIFKELSTVNVLNIERKLLNEILTVVLDYFNESKVRVLLSDEILININECSDVNMNFEFIKDLNAKIKSMKILVSAGFFELERIKPYDYYVRKYSDDSFKFKNIPKQYLPQVYKYYFNNSVEISDLLTIKNKKARILKFQ